MTRFARAKGSKSSNVRIPEKPTSWSEMKQQLLEKNKEADTSKERQAMYDQKHSNYKAFLKEKEIEEATNTKWADFPGVSNVIEKPKTNKNKKKVITKTSKSNINDNLNKSEVNTPKNDNDTISDSINKKQKIKKNRTKDVKEKTAINSSNEVNKNLIKENLGKSNSTSTTKIIKKRKSKNPEGPITKKPRIMSEQNEEVVNDQPVSAKKQKNIKKDTEQDLKKIEKKKQKKIKQLQKKKQFKKELKEQQQEFNNNQDQSSSDNLIQNNDGSSAISTNSNHNEFKPQKHIGGKREFSNQSNKNKKSRDKEEHPRKKPLLPHKMFINGREIEVAYVEGFPVKKEDAERLKKLRKEMISKGIPRSQINSALKLERRKAEKAFAREKKKVCFNCRKAGHNLSECPELNKNELAETAGSGICFKCGSTEHTHFECKVVRGQEFKFAQCFICNEQGHIARQCPDNVRGVYPKGGACNVCGDVTHLKRDCPTYKAQQEKIEDGLKIGTINNSNPDSMEEETSHKITSVKRSNKVIKFA